VAGTSNDDGASLAFAAATDVFQNNALVEGRVSREYAMVYHARVDADAKMNGAIRPIYNDVFVSLPECI